MVSRKCQLLASISLIWLILHTVHESEARPVSITSLSITQRGKTVGEEKPPSTFDQFAITTVTPQTDGLKRTKVLANGKFCPEKSGIDPKSSCVLPDVHTDRTWFQFTYASAAKDSSVTKPVITVVQITNNSVITPTVKDFNTTPEQGTGQFTVYYGCKTSGTAIIELKMKVTKTQGISMKWKKICGSGKNEFVTLTPMSLSSSGGTLESGPTEETTTVNLGVKYPQTFIEFHKPYLTSSNKDVGVELRGHVQAGEVTSEPRAFKVFYTCKTQVKSEISLTVAIPPWSNVTLSWMKNCGGSTPSGLNVLSGNEAVFNESGVAKRYHVTDTTTIREAKSMSIYEMDTEHSAINFDIRNVGPADLELQGVGITVSNPDVLAVTAEDSKGLLFNEERLLENKNIKIPTHKSTKLSLSCICLTRGAAVVLITLPIQGYKRVEFGFYKKCLRPHTFHHSGVFTTAPSLLFIFVCLLIVGGVFAYRYYRTRTTGTAKYTLVRAVSG